MWACYPLVRFTLTQLNGFILTATPDTSGLFEIRSNKFKRARSRTHVILSLLIDIVVRSSSFFFLFAVRATTKQNTEILQNSTRSAKFLSYSYSLGIVCRVHNKQNNSCICMQQEWTKRKGNSYKHQIKKNRHCHLSVCLSVCLMVLIDATETQN